jgi:hypothetical protein
VVEERALERNQVSDLVLKLISGLVRKLVQNRESVLELPVAVPEAELVNQLVIKRAVIVMNAVALPGASELQQSTQLLDGMQL